MKKRFLGEMRFVFVIVFALMTVQSVIPKLVEDDQDLNDPRSVVASPGRKNGKRATSEYPSIIITTLRKCPEETRRDKTGVCRHVITDFEVDPMMLDKGQPGGPDTGLA
ncbi:uncharacterized protein LOC144472024 isoform X1 [Augochlora pura]